MTTNHFTRSELNKLHNIVQNGMILYPKELVVATLRDYFSHDKWYSYRKDHFGFPQTPDHTNLPQEAGLDDSQTTRLWIGEQFKMNVIYYPSIIVRHGGATSVPISFNRETGSVQWDFITFEDGYGLTKSFRTPRSFIFAGAWEGSINIDVYTRDLRARDELTQLISLLFVDIAHEDMKKSGIFIQGVSSQGPTEMDDRNDKLFKETVQLRFRSEWRRNVPVGNIVELINFAIEFQRLDPPPGPIAQNLTIHTTKTLQEILAAL